MKATERKNKHKQKATKLEGGRISREERRAGASWSIAEVDGQEGEEDEGAAEDLTREYNRIGPYGRGTSVGVPESGNRCGGSRGGEEDAEESTIRGNCGIRLIGDFRGIGCGY